MTAGIARTLRLWFRFEDPVDARTYLVHGLALMLSKYAVDAVVVGAVTRRFWSPLDYLNPSLALRGGIASLPAPLLLGMMLWTLPFLWIGVGMSVRRAADAGRSPWWGLLFLVPIVNDVMMLALSVLPSMPGGWAAAARDVSPVHRIETAMLGIVVGIGIGLPLVAFCTLVLRRYGLALFLGTPFAIGAVTGSELLFRLGVAYPVRARITGKGVGALRRCEFSTGAFVEPITAWDAPRRLTFDVVDEPPPMRELSPWPKVHAAHLQGYFRAVQGEFRLVPLGDGRTRLEGSTWYTLDIHPQAYWNLWADALVQSIHHRVLEHIRRQAEAAARAPLGGNRRPAGRLPAGALAAGNLPDDE